MARDLTPRDTDYSGRTGDITDRPIVPYFELPTILPAVNTPVTTPATNQASNQSGFSLSGNIDLPFFGPVPTVFVIGGAVLFLVLSSGSGGRR